MPDCFSSGVGHAKLRARICIKYDVIVTAGGCELITRGVPVETEGSIDGSARPEQSLTSGSLKLNIRRYPADLRKRCRTCAAILMRIAPCNDCAYPQSCAP